jgi:ribosomal protein L7/L12
MNIQYAISNFEIMLVVDGKVTTVGLSHPMYIEICKALQNGDRERAVAMLDVKQHVEKVYADNNIEVKVTEQKSGDIDMEIDGHKVSGEIAKTLLMFKQAKLPISAIVKFWKKFTSNAKLGGDADYVRRQDLLRFIHAAGLYLLPNGNFIAFKGVNHYGDGGNGKQYRSQYDASFVYELDKPAVEPRAKQITDIHVACGVGLHAGSIGYAKSYGQLRLAVEIDPADVVTVPTGSDSHLRAWRMTPRTINPDDTAPVSHFIRLGDKPAIVGKHNVEHDDGSTATETLTVTEGREGEKRGIRLRLDSAGPSKINAIRIVRMLDGLGLADAKAFVESVPKELSVVVDSFARASEIVKEFADIGAQCSVVSGSTVTKDVVDAPKKRDRSKEKQKVRYYRAVGGKLVCVRKVVSPGAEWTTDKAAVVASLKAAPVPEGKKKAGKVKAAVIKAVAPQRTYYRVREDGKTVDTVRASQRPPGFTGVRPAWFSKK